MKSIDAKTLDQLITEMNEMNRWFAKVCNFITVKILTFLQVVKYWDEFSNGGDGSKVLQESGPGISQGEPGTKSGDADARELTNDDEAEEDAKNNEEDDGADFEANAGGDAAGIAVGNGDGE